VVGDLAEAEQQDAFDDHDRLGFDELCLSGSCVGGEVVHRDLDIVSGLKGGDVSGESFVVERVRVVVVDIGSFSQRTMGLVSVVRVEGEDRNGVRPKLCHQEAAERRLACARAATDPTGPCHGGEWYQSNRFWPQSGDACQVTSVSARQPSNRSAIDPFYVMEVVQAAEERELGGDEVLHLEVGQPSTPAPAEVVAAAHRALDDHVLGYTTASGTPALRARIAAHYRDWYDVAVDPDAVMLTVGASGAFVSAFLAAFDHGDRVVVPSPGYPCYRNALDALGCEVVDLPTSIGTRFQPTPDLLDELVAQSGPVRGLVLSSPSNPTGTVLDAAALAEVTAWCRRNRVWFISDEIYHGLTYGPPASTALASDPDAIVINSFSKYFSMTGWRLGWVIAPPVLRDSLTRLGQNLTISAPTLSQLGAIAAFDAHDECQRHLRRYALNRQIVLDGLAAAGFTELAPADGAFYVWASIDDLIAAGRTADSRHLCATWLDELGVATTPGVDFDPNFGDRFVRFSFSGDTDDCRAAMTRIGRWVNDAD